VDAARATVDRLQSGLPHVAWRAWRKAYQPDIDLITDPDTRQRFGPSGYAPGDVVNQPWMSFSLGADEIAGLVASAPPELAHLLQEDSTSQIRSITLEARSAAVVRAWFDSTPLGARFWRFPAGEAALSDGNTPPAGAWPAYVSGVVFARNITVVEEGAAGPPTKVAALPPLMLRAEVLRSLQPAVAAKPQPVVRVHPGVQVKRAPPAAARAPIHAQQHPTVVRRGPAIAGRPAPHPAAVATAHPAMATHASFVAPASRLLIATRPLAVVAPPLAAAPTPPPAPQTDERVSVLAFICTPLPKSPDPDPSLQW
jgi:hypothetical protein